MHSLTLWGLVGLMMLVSPVAQSGHCPRRFQCCEVDNFIIHINPSVAITNRGVELVTGIYAKSRNIGFGVTEYMFHGIHGRSPGFTLRILQDLKSPSHRTYIIFNAKTCTVFNEAHESFRYVGLPSQKAPVLTKLECPAGSAGYVSIEDDRHVGWMCVDCNCVLHREGLVAKTGQYGAILKYSNFRTVTDPREFGRLLLMPRHCQRRTMDTVELINADFNKAMLIEFGLR